MKYILIIAFILSLSSCHFIRKENGIEFMIENSSDSPIENVSFATSENLDESNFDKIDSNKSVSDFLTMKDNQSDGSYVLEFTRLNGEKEVLSFGYYSNGDALIKWIKFEVQNDTIITKTNRMKY